MARLKQFKTDTSYYKTGKFKKLQDKWYEKLKKKGFEDIEKGETLKIFSEKFVKENGGASAHYTLNRAKIAYYSNCRRFLNDYKFKNKTEKRIFEMHSDGVSIRDIAKKIRVSKYNVHMILRRLIGVMNDPF